MKLLAKKAKTVRFGSFVICEPVSQRPIELLASFRLDRDGHLPTICTDHSPEVILGWRLLGIEANVMFDDSK